jgi:hypothetical protein
MTPRLLRWFSPRTPTLQIGGEQARADDRTSKTSPINACASVIKPPPPNPCMQRPATSDANEGAIAQLNEPAKNSPSDHSNICFLPKASPRRRHLGAFVATWLSWLLFDFNLRAPAIILDHKIHTSWIPIYTRRNPLGVYIEFSLFGCQAIDFNIEVFPPSRIRAFVRTYVEPHSFRRSEGGSFVFLVSIVLCQMHLDSGGAETMARDLHACSRSCSAVFL